MYAYIRDEIRRADIDLDENSIAVTNKDKISDFIEITNKSKDDIDISGWTVRSSNGDEYYVIPRYILKASETIKIGDSLIYEDALFHWL